MVQSDSDGKRILISGFEIGGQMQLLAETIRTRCHSATAVAFNDDFRGYQNDIKLSGKGLRRSWSEFCFFLFAISHYKVFHFFWGVSLVSFWRFHLIDLPILRALNKKIIVHFRGLDVVDIAHFDYLREKARGGSPAKPPMSRPEQLRKLKKWRKFADHILVSEPDLHFVDQKSILSPQVIDMKYWRSSKPPLSSEDGIIRVVHAPSSRRKKGTDFIEEAIDRLKMRGVRVELVLAEDLPHDEIKKLYETADIGIDQVLYGWHGKVSVELMALGKPVICNIDPDLRKFRPDLPIIHAEPSNLEAVLEDLITNSNKRSVIGKQSVEYASRYHDVEIVVDQLFDLYGVGNKEKQKLKIENVRKW